MTDNTQQVPVIEIEEDNVKEEDTIKDKSPIPSAVTPQQLTIPRKKITELTPEEQQKIIHGAQNGIYDPYYNVKFFKNGKTRIVLKPQSTSQRIINEASINQPISNDFKRYYTDNQLLLEHIIALETNFSKLQSKHKKLKRRYNELEGYLYNYNDNDDNEPKQDIQRITNEPKQQQPTINAQEPQSSNEQQQPPIQRRYVRSWRDINKQ